MVGFLFGAAGMFATMYSTQAILPELSREFGVTPSQAGLTVSVVIVAIAVGAWLWGPLSDRIGRRRTLVAASALLVLPTIGAGLAPTFETLLAFRLLQGLCMPGLLTVGVPYVMEAFPALGGRAMGYYLSSLVVGGLVGRVGVALVAGTVGWRWGVGGLAILPLLGVLVMRRHLPEVPAARVSASRRAGLRVLIQNDDLLRAALTGSALFFTFVGTFSYVTYRLEQPPFDYGTIAGSLVFCLWVVGASGPYVGRLADRVGWRRVALGAIALALCGLLLAFPDSLALIVIGLALVTLAMFSGATAAQLGVVGSTDTDRGTASALYFSAYYTTGALGGYLPGLAWEAWEWPGVALLGLGVLAAAGLALASPARASR
jgi:YNFM family putative membrane transporter